MSLKPTPGSGKSGTSRTRVVRSIPATCRRLIDQAADVAAQQQVGELLGALREPLEVTESLLPALGVPRAQGRRDHRLEQAALAVGCGTEGAEVARVDPELRKRFAGGGDVSLALRVDPLAFVDTRFEQTELLEPACLLDRDSRSVAELLEVELLLPGLDDA